MFGQHVLKDKQRGGTLTHFLRIKAKPTNRRQNKTAGRGCIPNRIGIELRPKIVETKSRIGDWEADTIIGARHQGVILSLVDRKSKYTILKVMQTKTAPETTRAITQALRRLKKVHTIPCDNGKEFAEHQKISRRIRTKVFFANPYRSWERGLNEHTNGLVREYIPKATNIKLVSPSTVADIQNKLNNRPRKVLNYKTPNEIFHSTRTHTLLKGGALRP
jgi:IS30 family transposase